jgi:hypothetical protein
MTVTVKHATPSIKSPSFSLIYRHEEVRAITLGELMQLERGAARSRQVCAEVFKLMGMHGGAFRQANFAVNHLRNLHAMQKNANQGGRDRGRA